MILGCQRHNGIHLTGHPRIMDRYNGSGLLCDGSLYELFVHVHGIRPDIDKYRHGSPEHKCIGGGHKSVGGHNHFLPRSDAAQQCRQLRCMRTGSCQQTFCGFGLLFNPFITLFRICAVPADFLVSDTFLNILHGLIYIWRYIKINHILSPIPVSMLQSLHPAHFLSLY